MIWHVLDNRTFLYFFLFEDSSAAAKPRHSDLSRKRTSFRMLFVAITAPPLLCYVYIIAAE